MIGEPHNIVTPIELKARDFNKNQFNQSTQIDRQIERQIDRQRESERERERERREKNLQLS